MIRFVIVLFCCSILCGCNNEEKKVTFYPEYDYGSYSVQYNDSLIRIFFNGKDDSKIILKKVNGMYLIKDSFYVKDFPLMSNSKEIDTISDRLFHVVISKVNEKTFKSTFYIVFPIEGHPILELVYDDKYKIKRITGWNKDVLYNPYKDRKTDEKIIKDTRVKIGCLKLSSE